MADVTVLDSVDSKDVVPEKKRKVSLKESGARIAYQQGDSDNARFNTISKERMEVDATIGCDARDERSSKESDHNDVSSPLGEEGLLNMDNSSDSSPTPSESDWKPTSNGALNWIHTQMVGGAEPRDIIAKILPGSAPIPAHVDTWALWKLIIRILNEPPQRRKLSDVNRFEQVVDMIMNAKKIIVLTGAGVSVSCGIPDFRSRDGIYARLSVEYPDLSDPQEMFDISYFKDDPRPFFKFAKEIYPGQFKPSRSHRFIAALERTGRLLRNYTQNIDTLEQEAGISRVVQCHGSFATASCCKCGHQTDCESIRDDIFNQVVPHCTRCPGEDPGVVKPDIVFFGENLPDHFHCRMAEDKDQVDLLIVIGSSLKVRPVALIPNSLPNHVPQVLINREPLSHVTFDVELLGDCDVIISEISCRLGSEFAALTDDVRRLEQIDRLPDAAEAQPAGSNHSGTADSASRDSESRSHDTNSRSHDTNSRSHDIDATSGSTSPKPDDSDKRSRNTHSRSHDTDSRSHDTDSRSHDTDSQKPSTESRVTDVDSQPTADNSEQTSDVSMTSADASMTSVPPSTPEASKSPDQPTKPRSKSKPLWQSRWKRSISKLLPEGCFYYNGHHRYVFPGAEVSPEEESDSSDSSSDDDDPSTSQPTNHITGS